MTLTPSPRLLSLDFLRGLIMIFLMLESTELYTHLFAASEGTSLQPVLRQFFHHPWHGLRFWDLIQPGFMFMAGTAMAYSLEAQLKRGMTWRQSFAKTLKRSGWLFFWGVLDYAVRPQGLSFELWDVLTQLSFTTLVAFLVSQWRPGIQIGVSIALLVVTEVLYRFIGIPGFDQPFTDQHNFGNFMDLVLMNKMNSGGWVAINCLPTAAHTIWGLLAGRLLIAALPGALKLRWLAVAGLTALAIGYSLDATITPIIKRITTSSFVFASGGWCLLALALAYWWIDLKDHRRHLQFFTVVGMNALFIYLFIEIVAARWFNGYVEAIVYGLSQPLSVPQAAIAVASSLTLFALEWSLCAFLFRKGIFFKI